MVRRWKSLISEGLTMHKAYECKEEFSPDGKRLVRRERSVGGVVVFAVIVLVEVWRGQVVSPVSFWQLLGR